MSPEPSGPGDPSSVIRATRARDCRLPTERGITLSPEFEPLGGCACPLAVAWVPVLLTDPPRRCARMTALCPAPQVRREPGIPADAGPLGRSRRLGVAPPPDAGVAAVDASLVGGRAPVPHFLMPLLE